MKRIANARVVTEGRILENAAVDVEGGRVVSVTENASSRPGDVDVGGAYLLPGFLDIHVHPQRPTEPADIPDTIAGLSDELATLGVAGMLWTTGNMDYAALPAMAATVRETLEAQAPDCRVIGLHLEGPYIAPQAKGGFRAESICTPLDLPVETLLDAGGDAIKYVSLSPDLPGAMEAIATCVERGVRVGLCHSDASPDCVRAALDAGAQSIVHTFNNNRAYPMKEPGVRDLTLNEVGMVTEGVFHELICDGTHVDPVLVKILRKMKAPNELIVITDSLVGGVARDDGFAIRHPTGTMVIEGQVGRTPTGQLSGSVLTMARAVRNYVEFTGADLPEVVRVTSLNAARFLGMDDTYGRVAPGYAARFAALDDGLALCMDRLEELGR